MKESVYNKLETLVERYEEVQALLSDPSVISDQNRFRGLSKEYSELEEIVKTFLAYQQTKEDLASAEEMLKDSDPDMREMAQEEYKEAKAQILSLEDEIQVLMLPKDPKDNNNVFLEVRAGTGGDEAAIFAGDLFRMYSRFAETQKWKLEVVTTNEGEHGGYKEVIANISGEGVYGKLKFESGVHRVQRVPETESQGRVHTSACTVAVMAEIPEAEAIEINTADIKVDTFRASGAGGQHVNKTDSAIRLTHLPTGVVVECQDERSQHKNRAKAMSVLAARLQQAEDEKRHAAEASERRNLVGSGDRSERIRTYNYPQGRITDHRINLTLYRLNEVVAGDLGAIVDPLMQEHQADLLAAIQAACSDCSAEDVDALINDAIAAVGADNPLIADVLGAMSAAGIDSDTLTLAAVSAGVDATVASEATAAGPNGNNANPNAPGQTAGDNTAPNSNANPNARSRVPGFVSLPTPPGAGGNGGDDGISEENGN